MFKYPYWPLLSQKVAGAVEEQLRKTVEPAFSRSDARVHRRTIPEGFAGGNDCRHRSPSARDGFCNRERRFARPRSVYGNSRRCRDLGFWWLASSDRRTDGSDGG